MAVLLLMAPRMRDLARSGYGRDTRQTRGKTLPYLGDVLLLLRRYLPLFRGADAPRPRPELYRITYGHARGVTKRTKRTARTRGAAIPTVEATAVLCMVCAVWILAKRLSFDVSRLS